ncbi:hypothetical protein AT00_06390 [Pseudoalteromonas lipolytica SCSIO 04301]|uniref:hypothetical protein n=1 Tax=Pseudoalteromonas lipolytica TaxID=570156 RepID=UPI0004506DEF|nr:hypothetical protein [Pseudoalteromonas lipolytica]EWH07309.1 hypothetical protein AT00_06390 [Pseudoalteromonas lipolytica SCSIO 04301]
MPLLRWLSVIVFSSLLVACGGGGSLEKEGGSLDGGNTTDNPTYTITVQGYSADGTESNNVTADQPLMIRASLTSSNSDVTGKKITFSLADNLGTLDQPSALTNSEGNAEVKLNAGTQAGADEIIASFTSSSGTVFSGSFSFSTAGDNAQTGDQTFTVTLNGFVKGTQTSNNEVTAGAPLDLVATLKRDDEVISGQRVTFTLADDIGSLTPSSGTALTNNDGNALMTLTAGDVAGAGIVTASYTVSGETYFDTFAFTSDGSESDDSSVSGTVTLGVSIVDASGLPFSVENPVSKDNKGTVTATLLDDETPLAGQLISFSTNYTGKITPVLGTALTDANGEAFVTLSSGNSKGAGQVVATYTDESGNTITKIAGFISSGDDAPIENAEAALDIKLLKGCAADWDANRYTTSLETTYLSSGCVVVNQFSSDQLIDVLVKVTDTSSGDGIEGIIAELSTDLGRLLPESGKALTDPFGFAVLKLQPGANSGAGEVSVTAKSVTLSKAFEIATAELNVEITNGLYNKLDASGNPIDGEYVPLAAGATTVITVSIFDSNGNPIVTPLDVEFTSGCVESGLAVMDSKATSISGVATATYRTNGCNTSQGDTVTATVLTGGTPKVVNVNVPVSAAEVSSIEFIEATENVLALKGTGGVSRKEISQLTFKLTDEIGNAAKQKRMDFRISSTNGGISLSEVTDAGGYSHASVSTDSEGLARIQVNAGFVPQAVRVQACYIPEELIPADQNNNVTCWQELYLECQKAEAERNSNVSCPVGELSLVSLDEQVVSVSDLVSISSGLPDGNSFTAGPTIINIEALNYIGDTTDISVYLADHFNNPVPDGTAVYLTTEGGAVGTLDGAEFNPQLECNTVDGQCVAQWRSQNPKPFTEDKWGNKINSINPKTGVINCDLYFGSAAPCMAGIRNAAFFDDGVPLGARSTVLVTAKGQESYIDINGNGRFDTNEYYSGYDLPEAFIDHNENGFYDGLAAIYDPVSGTVTKSAEFCQEGDATDPCSPTNTNAGQFEENWDIDLNGMHTLADGKYNGLVCTESATTPTVGATFESLCTKEVIDIRDTFEIVMSGSEAYTRFVVTKAELRNRFASALNERTAADPTVFTDNAMQLGVDIAQCNTIYRQAGDSSTAVILDLEPTDNTDYCDLGSINITTAMVGNQLAALSFALYFSDVYNNPLPASTAVSVSTDNGDYSGTSGFELPNTSQTSAMSFGLTISREAEANKKAEGNLVVQFTTGKGLVTSAPIAISDDG